MGGEGESQLSQSIMKSHQSTITINSPCFSNFETRYLYETSIILLLVNANKLITSDFC